MESHEIYGQVTRIELVAGSEYATATIEIGESLNKKDDITWAPQFHLYDMAGTIALKGKPVMEDGRVAVMYHGVILMLHQWVKFSPAIVEWDDLPWAKTAQAMRSFWVIR